MQPQLSSTLLSYRRLAAAIAMSLTTLGVNAQDNSSSLMPTIEVIGRQQGDIYRQTGSVVIIDRLQIERVQPLSTEDILRRVPGINVKSEEESSIISNIGIRGLSASESKSLLLEDGVPVAPGLFIGNDRYFNPRIQRVDMVEILKGSASLRYGPATIGGVVNYQTKTPSDGLIVNSRVGSFNMREVGIEAGHSSRSGDGFAGIVVTHASSDGFMDKGYEMNDIMVKAGVAFNDSQRIGIKFSWYENDANISYRGLLLDDYLGGATYNPAPDDYFLSDRIAFDINHEWLLGEGTTLKTLAYWSDVTRDYWRYNVDTAASNRSGHWVYTDNLTGNNRSFERFGLESRLSRENKIFGLDSRSEFGLRLMQEESNDTRIRATRDQDRTGINDRHRIDSANSIAVHAQSRIALSDLLAVTPGLRVESYEQEQLILTQNNATESTSNTEFLPGIGFTYELGSSTQLFGGIYRAFAPASNGVALDGLKDQNLDGERSTNIELGFRGFQGSLNYEVVAFVMEFGNQVVTGNSDPNLSQSNAGETSHFGMEMVAGYELSGGFSLDANATWVPESEFRTGESRGNRLPYAPRLLGNLALDYSSDRLGATLRAHYRGKQFGDPANRVDIPTDAAGGIWGGLLPSYTVFDLMANYGMSESLRVFGTIKNITDRRYITGLREGIYVGPGRTFEIGFRYRL